MDEVAWVSSNGCKRCGIPMSGFAFEGLTCEGCREIDPFFRSGRCLFVLNRAGKNLIHEIKYHGVRSVLEDMPHWMDRTPGIREFLAGSVLVPVPLHRSRIRSRGFNQSLWIAQAICKEMGDQTVVLDLLERKRDTSTQTRLDRSARKANVKNAFALKPGTCLDRLKPMVLIDDVFTTGATLDSCAQVLVESGFNNLNVFALGHG
jgi:ComF family protein